MILKAPKDRMCKKTSVTVSMQCFRKLKIIKIFLLRFLKGTKSKDGFNEQYKESFSIFLVLRTFDVKIEISSGNLKILLILNT